MASEARAAFLTSTFAYYRSGRSFAAALTGGIVGGLLWQTAGTAFALFVAGSTRYSAIYSSFAVLILFLIWVYVSWLVLLFGAAVAFYRQYPEYILPQSGEPRMSNRMRERIALAVMGLVAQHHREGAPAWTLAQLGQRLAIPSYALKTVLSVLRAGQLLAQTNDDPPAYLPTRDLRTVSVAALLETIRTAGEDLYLNPERLPVSAPVAQALQRFDRSVDSTLAGMSVAGLAAVDHGPEADLETHGAAATDVPPAGEGDGHEPTR